jgi:hypothetical protein
MVSLMGKKLSEGPNAGRMGGNRDYGGGAVGALAAECDLGRARLVASLGKSASPKDPFVVVRDVAIAPIALTLEARSVNGSVAPDGRRRLVRGGRAFNLFWEARGATDLSKVTSLVLTGTLASQNGTQAMPPVDLTSEVTAAAGQQVVSRERSTVLVNDQDSGADTDMIATFTLTCQADGHEYTETIELRVLTGKPPLTFDDPRLSPIRKKLNGFLDEYLPAVYQNDVGGLTNKNGKNLFAQAGWGVGTGQKAKDSKPRVTSCGDVLKVWLVLLGDSHFELGITGFQIVGPGRKAGIFVESDGVKLPMPGDLYAINAPGETGMEKHVGVVTQVSVNEDDPWATSDGGQGALPSQTANNDNPCKAVRDASGQLFLVGADAAYDANKAKRLIGWVDLDLAFPNGVVKKKTDR